MKKYQPSNGTEGMYFIEEYCMNCIHCHPHPEKQPQCDILCRTLMYDINDPEYPNEWIYNSLNEPMCTAHVNFDWGNEEDGWNDPDDPDGPNIPLYPDPNQLQMFPIYEGFYFGPNIIITPIAVTEETFI